MIRKYDRTSSSLCSVETIQKFTAFQNFSLIINRKSFVSMEVLYYLHVRVSVYYKYREVYRLVCLFVCLFGTCIQARLKSKGKNESYLYLNLLNVKKKTTHAKVKYFPYMVIFCGSKHPKLYNVSNVEG